MHELKPYNSIITLQVIRNPLEVQDSEKHSGSATPHGFTLNTRSSFCVSMQGVLAINQNIYMLLNSAVT